jgi:hypothetical protein
MLSQPFSVALRRAVFISERAVDAVMKSPQRDVGADVSLGKKSIDKPSQLIVIDDHGRSSHRRTGERLRRLQNSRGRDSIGYPAAISRRIADETHLPDDRDGVCRDMVAAVGARLGQIGQNRP